MEKRNDFEALVPCSGQYSLIKDLRLNAWLGVTMAVYLLGPVFLRQHPEWGLGVRCAVKLAPLPFMLLYMRSWTRFVRSLDELQRSVQVSAFLFAGLGTAILGAVMHTLAAQGVVIRGLPLGIGLGGLLFWMALFWPVGLAIARCRYK
jgi:hypothetical protein